MRVLLLFTIGFALASGLAAYFLTGGWWLVGLGLCGFPLLGCFALSRKARKRAQLVTVGAILGFLWCGCYRAVWQAPAEAYFTGEPLPFSAVVLEEPSETTYGASLLLEVQTEDGAAFHALCYLSEHDPDIVVGDTITATGKFRTSSLVQGKTSYTYTAKGTYAIISSVKEFSVTGNIGSSLTFLPYRCAAAIQEVLSGMFSGDNLGLAEALLTGETDNIPDDLYTALQRSGTAHIVSVSGLHVMLLTSLLMRVPGELRRKRLCVIPLLWFFALVTGCRPSIVRAALMQTLLLLAPLVEREYDAPTGLSGALLVLLVQNPNAIAGVGLQLSFASVAGLLTVSPQINNWLAEKLEPLERNRRLYHPLMTIGTFVSASCGAQLFSTPLCAIYFGSVSLVGIVANLLVLPVLGLLFGLLLLGTLMGIVCPLLGKLVASVCDAIMLYICSVCRGIGSLNYSALSTEPLPLLLWIAFACILALAFFFFLPLRKHAWKLALCGVLSLVGAILFHLNSLTSAPVTIQVVDVGQGQCVVSFSGDETYAVDCGGNSGSAGEHLANLLQNANRAYLDALIFTHYDSDHTGGLEDLLTRISVKTLYIPDILDENREAVVSLAEKAGCTVLPISETTELTLAGGTITLYAPLTGGEEDNDGLSVLFQSGSEELLLTGDLNLELEEALVAREALPDVEYLIAGHHGSKYATGDALLDAVTPETVIISVGYNTYGHPTEEALARIASHGCTLLRTDQDGTCTVRLGVES